MVMLRIRYTDCCRLKGTSKTTFFAGTYTPMYNSGKKAEQAGRIENADHLTYEQFQFIMQKIKFKI